MRKKKKAQKEQGKRPSVTGSGSKPLLVILLSSAVVLTLVAYARSLHGPFVFDDTYIIDAGRLKKLVHFFRLGARSIPELSFALNFLVSGMSPEGFRVINLVLHVLTALSAFALTRFTMNTPFVKERFGRHSLVVSTAAAVLFLLHPVQTSTVNYITQRMAIMAGMFSLIGLLLYGKAALETERRSLLYYLLSAFLFFLAIFSKENSVMVLVMLPLYDLVFVSSFQWKEFRKRFIPFAVLSAVLVLVALTTLSPGDFMKNITPLLTHPFRPMGTYIWSGVDLHWTPAEYVLTELRVVSRYIVLILFPSPSMMIFDYSNAYPVSRGLFQPFSTFVSLAFLASLLFLSVASRKKFPLLSFGVLWYLVTISLESFVALGLDPYFEHRNYLPSFGLFLAIASLIAHLDRPPTGASPGATEHRSFGRSGTAITVLLLALFVATYIRNGVWTSEELLWRDTMEKSANNPRAYINLAAFYIDDKRFQEAEEVLHRGEQIPLLTPTFKTTLLFKKAMLYEKTDRRQEAVAILKSIVSARSSTESNRSDAYFAMGEMQRSTGNLRGAADLLEKAYELRQDNPALLTSLGFVYESLGETGKAEGYFRKSLERAPDQLPPNVELGLLAFARGDTGAAEQYLGRAAEAEAEIPPQLAKKIFLTLAQMRLARNELDASAGFLKKVVEADPKFYPPYIFLGDISMKKGEYDAALAYLRQALSMKETFVPGDPNAKLIYFKLGQVQNARGDTQSARENLSRFLALASNDRGLEGSVRSAKEILAQLKK